MFKIILTVIVLSFAQCFAAELINGGFEEVDFPENTSQIESPKINGWNISGGYWNIYKEQANEMDIIEGENSLYLFNSQAVQKIGKIRIEKIYNLKLFVAANDVNSAKNSFVVLQCDKGNGTFVALDTIRLSSVINDTNLKHFQPVTLNFNAASRPDLKDHTLRIVLISGGMAHFDGLNFSEEDNSSEDVLILENDYVKFVFEGKYKSPASMLDKRTDIEHINLVPGQGFYDKPLKSELWQIKFEQGDNTELISSLDLPCTSSIVENLTDGGKTALLKWTNVSLRNSPNSVNIKVIVNLPKDSGIAKWNIDIENNSKIWGLAEIKFPYIAGLLEKAKYDIALPRKNIGLMYNDCSERLFCEYGEGWWMPAQFILADMNNASVYMAAHDPQGWPKYFVCDPGKEFFIQMFPENIGIAGSDFISPYPLMLGVYNGNWIEGCKIYRQFAVNNAKWTANGKLKNNKAVPELAKNVGVWLNVGDYHRATADVKEKNKSINDFQAEFNSPVGVHWYRWHNNIFDHQLPHYFPAKPQVTDQIRDLAQDSNYVIMPYINARVVSYDIEDINDYMPLLCKDKYGSPYEELYGPAPKTLVVCPYTEKWQNYIYDLTRRIVDELGVNAIYLDQVAGAPIKLCYDKNHGHPIGGGSWWVEGYRKMLAKLRTIKDKNGNQIVVTTEFAAEPYMDMADSFLIWMLREPNDLPMLPMVYSGYTLYFGSNCYFPEDKAWKIVQARCLLWGIQNGWMPPEYILDEKNVARKDFFKKVISMRNTTKKYLVYGELINCIDSENKFELKWNGKNVSYPQMQAAVWLLEDKIAVIIANYSDEQKTFETEIPVRGKIMPGNDYIFNSQKNSVKIFKTIDPENLEMVEIRQEKEN
ncbi:MAG: hypothetical protein A2Y10_11310 [Planctomycetes bacterium GWF2_41_51]|nr:MAG: hypothetical protein A2Y10_11310 [Planctomycetes bacterium GWF2_41_51]HBG26884.1 hypothetical protein [Phycisphaerales bacterium]